MIKSKTTKVDWTHFKSVSAIEKHELNNITGWLWAEAWPTLHECLRHAGCTFAFLYISQFSICALKHQWCCLSMLFTAARYLQSQVKCSFSILQFQFALQITAYSSTLIVSKWMQDVAVHLCVQMHFTAARYWQSQVNCVVNITILICIANHSEILTKPI